MRSSVGMVWRDVTRCGRGVAEVVDMEGTLARLQVCWAANYRCGGAKHGQHPPYLNGDAFVPPPSQNPLSAPLINTPLVSPLRALL